MRHLLLWATILLGSAAGLTKKILKRSLASLLVTLTPISVLAQGENVNELLLQGSRQFEAGKLRESVDSFREAEILRPDLRANLWQKGLAQYAVGEYGLCAAQFHDGLAAHPQDAEEAVFYLACLARLPPDTNSSQEPRRARQEEVDAVDAVRRPDRRQVMNRVYEVFAGRQSPEVLEELLLTTDPPPNFNFDNRLLLLDQQRFYAGFYLGLHAESVLGDDARAFEFFQKALGLEYARPAAGVGPGAMSADRDYMVRTCKVLRNRMRMKTSATPTVTTTVTTTTKLVK